MNYYSWIRAFATGMITLAIPRDTPTMNWIALFIGLACYSIADQYLAWERGAAWSRRMWR